jgi:rare lipoprotein A (peptidoglycan hydrolase)
MNEYEFRRQAAIETRTARPRTPIEHPDRIALWAVVLSVIAMVAGVASADAGSGGASYQSAEFDDAPTQLATWYGPGFYGEKTACGETLTRRTIGVAHRRLPCGTRVAFLYKGKYLETEVIDRGPYGTRARWDLTQRAAERIGLETTDEVRVARLGKRRNG